MRRFSVGRLPQAAATRSLGKRFHAGHPVVQDIPLPLPRRFPYGGAQSHCDDHHPGSQRNPEHHVQPARHPAGSHVRGRRHRHLCGSWRGYQPRHQDGGRHHCHVANQQLRHLRQRAIARGHRRDLRHPHSIQQLCTDRYQQPCRSGGLHRSLGAADRFQRQLRQRLQRRMDPDWQRQPVANPGEQQLQRLLRQPVG